MKHDDPEGLEDRDTRQPRVVRLTADEARLVDASPGSIANPSLCCGHLWFFHEQGHKLHDNRVIGTWSVCRVPGCGCTDDDIWVDAPAPSKFSWRKYIINLFT